MIIFFYGDDFFRSAQKVAEIKNKFLLSDKSASGLSVFECGESASSADRNIIGNIVNTVSTANLLAPKRLLIVKNALAELASEEQKILLDFLKKNKNKIIDDNDVVVVFWEGNQSKKNNTLFKFLISSGVKKQNFEKLSGKKLESWILKTLLEIDGAAKISQSALEKLSVFCNGDTQLIFSELQKLVGFSSEQMIAEKDVDLLVRANLDTNIFQMVDALGAGDKRKALHLLHNHLQSGDDPFYLLSMFFYQFRNMLKVADFKENQSLGEYEIARLAKMHPFVVKKSLAQIARLPLAKLKEIYGKLAELDTAVKTGKIEIRLGLDKFVAEL